MGCSPPDRPQNIRPDVAQLSIPLHLSTGLSGSAAIAVAVKAAIESPGARLGDTLPSAASLSREHHLPESQVKRAYRELATAGLITLGRG